MKYLLHIDTSGESGMAMLSVDGQVVACAENQESRAHAQTLNGLIDTVLKDSGAGFDALESVVVCAGPGSYTGLRIGMAAAKGICYAQDIPLVLHNKLTLLAWQARETSTEPQKEIVALLAARQHEFFVSHYDSGFAEVMAPCHILMPELIEIKKNFENALIISDLVGILDFFPFIATNQLISNTKIESEPWAKFSTKQIFQNGFTDLFAAQPFYLKDVYTHN